MRSGERDPIDPLQAEGVRGAQAPCRKSVSATTHPAPPNHARAPSGAVTRIHRGRMAIPMPPSRPRPTTASLTNSHRAGSDVVGGCMQSSRTSSKRPRLQVKAGMRLAARTSPNANSTPRAQAYRELPEGSTGRRRIRHQMATPTPTLTTDAIVSSAAPAERATHSPAISPHRCHRAPQEAPMTPTPVTTRTTESARPATAPSWEISANSASARLCATAEHHDATLEAGATGLVSR
jgi:hypothetical protein